MLVHQFNATNIKFINPVPVPIWAELGPAQPQLVINLFLEYSVKMFICLRISEYC